jgi:chromosome segregation ATPase
LASERIQHQKETQIQLLHSIRNVETELDDCLKHLNQECTEIQSAIAHLPFDQIHSLRPLDSELELLDSELEQLEQEAKTQRKDNHEKQEITQRIQKMLVERYETGQSDLSEFRSLVNTDEEKMRKIKAKLEDILSRNAYLEAAVDSLVHELGDQPNFCEIVKEEIAVFQEESRKKWNLHATKLKELRQQKSKVVENLKKRGAKCDILVGKLQNYGTEIEKVSQFSRKSKRKEQELLDGICSKFSINRSITFSTS